MATTRPGGIAVPGRTLRQRFGRGEGRSLREVVAVRILPGAADQIVEHLQRDIDEHQARKHLRDAVARLQQGRDRRPDHAAQNAGRDHQRDDPECGRVRQEKGDAGARQRADDVLPFGADVPDLRLVAERQSERDDDERRGLGQDVLPFVGGDDRRDESLVDRVRAVEADQLEDDRAEQPSSAARRRSASPPA